jgi:hypothetical protein
MNLDGGTFLKSVFDSIGDNGVEEVSVNKLHALKSVVNVLAGLLTRDQLSKAADVLSSGNNGFVFNGLDNEANESDFIEVVPLKG